MESILLDAGVCSRKDATELLGLEPGLVAVPDVQFSYNDATGLMLGKAFDCRLGCAGVVEVLRALKDETLCADVTAAFSTQEEVGLRGAKSRRSACVPHWPSAWRARPRTITSPPRTRPKAP